MASAKLDVSCPNVSTDEDKHWLHRGFTPTADSLILCSTHDGEIYTKDFPIMHVPHRTHFASAVARLSRDERVSELGTPLHNMGLPRYSLAVLFLAYSNGHLYTVLKDLTWTEFRLLRVWSATGSLYDATKGICFIYMLHAAIVIRNASLVAGIDLSINTMHMLCRWSHQYGMMIIWS